MQEDLQNCLPRRKEWASVLACRLRHLNHLYLRNQCGSTDELSWLKETEFADEPFWQE
jgi:hypothetical protein